MHFSYAIYMVGLVLNKAGYTATPVTCGWERAIFETRAFGQEQYGQIKTMYRVA